MHDFFHPRNQNRGNEKRLSYRHSSQVPSPQSNGRQHRQHGDEYTHGGFDGKERSGSREHPVHRGQCHALASDSCQDIQGTQHAKRKAHEAQPSIHANLLGVVERTGLFGTSFGVPMTGAGVCALAVAKVSSHQALVAQLVSLSRAALQGRRQVGEVAKLLVRLKCARVDADYRLSQDVQLLDAQRAVVMAKEIVTACMEVDRLRRQ